MSKYVKMDMKKMEKEKERIKMCKRAVVEIRNMDGINPHDAATKLLGEYENELPTPIIKIVKDAGFSVYVQDLPQNIGGYIIVNADLEKKFNTDKIIVVNESENAKRRRFTVAHEFGHFLFDFKSGKEFSNAFENDNTRDSQAEKRVNAFAAELLMPKEKFFDKFKELKEKNISEFDIISILSDYFLTPIKSVEKRIAEIGLIEELS